MWWLMARRCGIGAGAYDPSVSSHAIEISRVASVKETAPAAKVAGRRGCTDAIARQWLSDDEQSLGRYSITNSIRVSS